MAQSPQMNYLSTYIYGILGHAYLESNQLDISSRHFLSCLHNSYRFMDPQFLILALQNLGTVMERSRRFDAALNYYEESERWLRTILDDGLQRANSEAETQLLDVQNMLGNLAIKMNDFTTAEAQFRESLQGRPHPTLEARNRIGLSQVYLAEKKFAQAESEADEALALAMKNSYYEAAWQANNLKGMLLRLRGNVRESLVFFTRATQIIETTRTAIPIFDLRQSYFSQRYDPYRNMVSLLLSSNKDPTPALSYVNRAKAITLRENLNLQTDSAKAPKQQFLNYSKSYSLPELPPGFFTLEYFFGIDEVFVFLSNNNGTAAVSIPSTAADLEALVREYRESIQKNDTASFDRLSRRLYGILINPILQKKRFEASETLVILADGPLHMLPFDSLMDSEGHYLLEKTAISYAPSRSVLQYCLDKQKSGRITSQSSIFLMDGASNLQGAAREMASIANLYATNRLIFDPDSPSLDSSIGHYEIIHFSGHAELHMGRPRLVFRTPSGKKYLDSQAFQKWKLQNNKLVALAGCNTGVGPIFDGETPWSLVPSLLSAGAPSILVSLLPVDDLATASFASRFYELLAHGDCSKAQALRSAQLSLLNAEARHRPSSWIPFVLIGNPN
jgi:CHAT domain-containing protein